MIADAFVPLVQREMEIKQQDIQDHDGQGKSSTLKVAAMISPVASCTESHENSTHENEPHFDNIEETDD